MLVREILNRTNNGLDWLQAYYGKPFQKAGKGYRSKCGKVSLRMGDAYGEPCWFGVDFTEKMESGSPFTIISKEKGIRGKDVIQFLADELNLSGGDLANWKPAPIRQEEKPEFPYLVNNDRNKEPSKSYRYEVSQEPIKGYPKKISPETLQRYRVRPLAWIEHSKGYRTTATESDPLFLFTAGGNTKIYKPKGFSGSGGKQRPGTYLGNYCFGYDQLPESCEHILICAGQNDTLAANDILNESGIYAVCLWSEGSEKYLSPELLQDLQSRCKSLFVAYDDDETGNRTASAISDKYGIAGIQIPHKYGENDICDLLDAGISKDRIKADVLRFVRKHEIQESPEPIRLPYDLNPTPMPLPEIKPGKAIGRKPGAEYISDYIEEIVSELHERKRFILKAQPGAGKTTALVSPKIDSIASILRRETGLPVAVFMPLNLIIKQQEAGTGLPVITGATSPQDTARAIESGIFLANFASVGKVLSVTGDNLIPCIDEIHLLPSAQYMEGENWNLSELFRIFTVAPYALGLSGTPQSLFAAIGATTVSVQLPAKQTVALELIASDKDSDVTTLEHLLSIDTQDLTVVRVNNTTLSAGMADQLTEKENIPGRIIQINSDTDDEDREYLEREQEIKGDVGLAFVTSIADVGGNINNESASPIICQTSQESRLTPEEIAQFLKRFRRVDSVDAKLFFKEREVKTEDLFSMEQAQTLIASERARNQAYANLMNLTPEPEKRDGIIKAFSSPADNGRIIKVKGRYQVNELWLLREALRLRDKGLTTGAKIAILHQYLDNLTVSQRKIERGNAETEEKAELKQHKAEAKQVAAITAGTVHQMIVQGYRVVIDSALHCEHKGLNRDAKRWLRSFGYNEDSANPEQATVDFLNDANPKDLIPLKAFISMTTGRERHSTVTAISILNSAANLWSREANEGIEMHLLKAEFSKNPKYWNRLAEEKKDFIDRLDGLPYYNRDAMSRLLNNLEALRLIYYTSAGKLGSLPKRQEFRGMQIRSFVDSVSFATRYSEFFTSDDLKRIYLKVFGNTQIDLAEDRATELFKAVYDYRSRVEIVTGEEGEVIRKDELFAVNSKKKFSLFLLNAKISVPLDDPKKWPSLLQIVENGVLLEAA